MNNWLNQISFFLLELSLEAVDGLINKQPVVFKAHVVVVDGSWLNVLQLLGWAAWLLIVLNVHLIIFNPVIHVDFIFLVRQTQHAKISVWIRRPISLNSYHLVISLALWFKQGLDLDLFCSSAEHLFESVLQAFHFNILLVYLEATQNFMNTLTAFPPSIFPAHFHAGWVAWIDIFEIDLPGVEPGAALLLANQSFDWAWHWWRFHGNNY